jgi:hypothetical protein
VPGPVLLFTLDAGSRLTLTSPAAVQCRLDSLPLPLPLATQSSRHLVLCRLKHENVAAASGSSLFALPANLFRSPVAAR